MGRLWSWQAVALQRLRDGLTAGACAPHAFLRGHRSWREIAAVLRKDRRFHASTAHPPQQSNLPSPPRLPGALGFKEESGLSWAEIVRRLDIHHETMRRWRKGRARPSMRNMMALVALARPLGLAHLFTD